MIQKSKVIKHVIIISSSIILIFLVTSAQMNHELKSGNDLIHKMYQKYQNKWYTNLTFKQKMIFYENKEVSKKETWHEAMRIPEGLIVKMEDIDGGDGLLFKNDSLTIFKEGKITDQMRRVHELLVLGFNVYVDKPETTISKLEEVGFDLKKIKKETINGKSYFVVGDASKKQFWIDAEHLLFTKVEMHKPNGQTSTIEFKDYEKLKNGWISPTVVFYKNGELFMKETYYDIEVPKTLPKNLLENESFSEMKW